MLPVVRTPEHGWARLPRVAGPHAAPSPGQHTKPPKRSCPRISGVCCSRVDVRRVRMLFARSPGIASHDADPPSGRRPARRFGRLVRIRVHFGAADDCGEGPMIKHDSANRRPSRYQDGKKERRRA